MSSVCLSVRPLVSNSKASASLENAITYSAGNEGQKNCRDLPETTAFKSYAAKHERKSQYYSDLPAVSFLRLTHSEASEGTQRSSTAFGLAQNYGLLIIALACFGARTDITTRSAASTHARERRGQLPRTRIDVVRKMKYYFAPRFAPRVLHFSAFHVLCKQFVQQVATLPMA